MKKVIVYGLLVLMFCSFASALTLSGPVPANGAYLKGNSSEYFKIDGDVGMTVARVYINTTWAGWVNYPLTCVGTTCSGTVDLSAYSDLKDYLYYFWADGEYLPVFGTYNSFIINRMPTAVTGLDVIEIDDTTLQITWDAKTDADFGNYLLYRNGSLILTQPDKTNVTYVDTGLTTMESYGYVITMIDNMTQVATNSSEEVGTPQDATPPAAPVIRTLIDMDLANGTSLLANDLLVNGTTIETTEPQINITYAEDVAFKITTLSGVTIKDFGTGRTFNWTPAFFDNGTEYKFLLNATDDNDNSAGLIYQIATWLDITFGIDITEMDFFQKYFFVKKGQVLPPGHVTIGFNISMYPNEYLRVRMGTLTCGGQVVNSNPIAFCEEDWNSTTQNISMTPVKNVYNVNNTYDLTQNALNCTDTLPLSARTEYRVLINLPIGEGTASGACSISYIAVQDYAAEI